MGFLENLLGKQKKKESVVLVDVGAESVAGAYVVYEEGETPVMIYTRRLPVEPHENEVPENAMIRALESLCTLLIHEGAPALARFTGSGAAAGIAVVLGAPWQKSMVRIDHFEKPQPMLFTRELVAEATHADGSRAPGKLFIEEHMIGAVLNGYRTPDPFGKKANRISIVVLASLLDERIGERVTGTLRKAFHTDTMRVLPGSGLRFEAVHAAFPHEDDALVLDATTAQPTIGVIRNGLPRAIEEVPVQSTRHGMTAPLSHVLTEFSKKFPLPRTIFLLAEGEPAEELQKSLKAPPVRKLWLSDDPPKIIPVRPSHLSGLVRQAGTATPDLKLLLVSLYHQVGEA